MTKEEFKVLFDNTRNEILQKTAEELPKKLKEVSKNGKTISTEEMFPLLLTESFFMSEKLIYRILEKVLVKD